MKISFIILSAVAAVAYAAADQKTQDQVFQTYTAPSFPLSASEIQFRQQKNADSYFAQLKTFNNLITPKEFPASALPLAIVTPEKANNKGLGKAIKVAKKNGLRVSARSGGYQSGYSANMAALDNAKQDFVLLDLSKLNKVTIDPKRRTATAEPGTTGLELYTETIKYGLHFPGPHTARVTIGGFLLQGGMGIGSRYHGAGVDNVIGFEMINSAGKTVYADAKTNKDLFYAVRGGGQFFGVITKFHLRLVPMVKNPTLVPTYNATSVAIDQVFAIFDRPQANDLLSFYGKFDPKAPKALENKVVFVVDAKTNNKQYLFASVSAAPFNTSTAVTKAQADITKWYKTIPTNFATSDPSTYSGVIHGSDASWADSDLSYYAEDVWFRVPLDPKLQEVLIRQWDKVPSALSSMALNTGTWDAPTRSALGYDRSYSLCVYSTWKRNGTAAWDEQNKAWLDETMKAIKPWTLGYYANELRPKKIQDKDYWSKCYEKKTYKTLKVTKNRWDPENIFKSL
ncbi:FAD linked oxidase domain protein [Gryganskiella cystojenkinii]|nr:FAD linked oxidase domain protein [Gryganskiella cystojenkinii]